MVRCAACSHVWRAEREPAEPEEATDPLAALDDEVDPFAVEDHGFTPAPAPTSVEPRRKNGLAAWGAAAGLVVGVLGAAVIFRADMVRLWPNSASAFSLIGLETTASGLVIEKNSITARREVGPEGSGLRVTALVRNPTGAPIPAPYVQVHVRDAQGRVVLEERGALEVLLVQSQQVGRFSLWIPDAPAEGADVELRLLTGAYPAGPAGADDDASARDLAGELGGVGVDDGVASSSDGAANTPAPTG